MRLAVLADIHGNLPALQAIAMRLETLQPDAVIIVGDIINAVPFSSQVIDFIRKTNWIAIRGNHEFYYLDFESDRAQEAFRDPVRWGQLHWLVAHLREDQARYLAALPDDLTLYFPGTQPVRATHGVPGDNRRGFINKTPDTEIARHLAGIPQDTLINAHSHRQVDRLVSGWIDANAIQSNDPLDFLETQQVQARQWHLINPGSAGLPLNGDVRAQFAIIDDVAPQAIHGGWRVHHYREPYDRRPALEAYRTSGMLEAGGVISQLFYWELVTARPEIPYFFNWRRSQNHAANLTLADAFIAYCEATGREAYIRQRDPLRA